jgi:ABC-type multidrug transport system ATPase subunit
LAGALSGGMRQKLAISCALLAEPQLLLLDEATAGVDVVARDEIWSMLHERRSHALVVLSTSYLEEVEECDYLVYLDGGRVVASGTPAELRAGVELELYRAWGAAPRTIAAAARALPYVGDARAIGGYARIEVPRARTPGARQVHADLMALAVPVQVVEPMALDAEAMLLALARGAAG